VANEPYDAAFPRYDFAEITLSEVFGSPILQLDHDFFRRNYVNDFTLELVRVQSLILNFDNQAWPKPGGWLRLGMF
jgi:hypothetical protein